MEYYTDSDFAKEFAGLVDTVFADKDTSGFVYIILDANTKWIKIGRTKNIERRIKNLRNANLCLSLYQFKKVKNYYEAETYLHQKFSNKNIEGEWFSISPELAYEELCKLP